MIKRKTMAKSTEMLDERTENNKGLGSIVSASLAPGATNQTCKEKGADRRSTAGDGHADVSIPLYGGLDEAVKGQCLQVGWLPFQ